MVPSAEAAAWAGALATLLAVLAALFKEDIVQVWRKPELTVRVALAPPDCHLTQIVYGTHIPAPALNRAACYYLRIWVKNDGKQRATQVQVFAAGLARQQADGSFRNVTAFLPMNLRWAHGQTREGGPEIFADGISRDMGKHCDLGHIVDPRHRVNLGHELLGVGPDETILALDLEVQPNTLSYLLPPGVYRLTLKLAAANARPATKVIELNHTGRWYDDEGRMFSDGVGMREVNS